MKTSVPMEFFLLNLIKKHAKFGTIQETQDALTQINKKLLNLKQKKRRYIDIL